MFDVKVRDQFGLAKTDGDVGVEIEMEVNGPMFTHPPKNWREEEDGSLRGFGYEYVLNKPVPLADLNKHLTNLTRHLQENGRDILPSIRAGVHVHVNMQEQTIGELLKFFIVYSCMDTVLTNWCGEGRQGNLFCLRGKDTPMYFLKVAGAIKSKDIYNIRTDDLRYSSINLQSMFKYGSVEFRALGTTPDFDKIETWCEILCKIKEYACRKENIWDVVLDISGMGPKYWVESVIGKGFTDMISYQDMDYDIMSDVRNVQIVCSQLRKEGL